MIRKNNETTAAAEYNRENESRNMLEMFKKQGVTVNPVIPEGEHVAKFLGMFDKEFKNNLGVFQYSGLVIKLSINGKEFEHNMPFSAKTGEASQAQFTIYQGIMTDIARQFQLSGAIYIDDLNKHINEEINLHVVIKDGKRYTNFYKMKPKETATIVAEILA